MFRRLSEPLPLSEASLLALRPALNTPVLNVGFVPVGPARAAIVAFAEEWGGIGVALGIRSNEAGQVVVFRNRASIEPDVPVVEALEPALAEAERLGFLFDEDMVASDVDGQGRTQALGLWGRLMGELDLPPAPRAAPPEPAATESIRMLPPRTPVVDGSTEAPTPAIGEASAEPVPELILDDLAEAAAPAAAPRTKAAAAKAPATPRRRAEDRAASAPELILDEAVASDGPVDAASEITEPLVPTPGASDALPPVAKHAPAEAEGGEALPAARQLSKFRQAEADADAGGPGNQLGRISLKRVRKGRKGGEGVSRVSYLARLLSSF